MNNLQCGWLNNDNAELFGKRHKNTKKKTSSRQRPPAAIVLHDTRFKRIKPAVDASRHPVPKSLERIFHGRQEMAAVASKLFEMQSTVRRWTKDSCGADLDAQSIAMQIDAIRNRILQAAPYCVCGCSGCNGSDCPFCEGKQWLSAGEYLKTGIPTHVPQSSGFCKIDRKWRKSFTRANKSQEESLKSD